MKKRLITAAVALPILAASVVLPLYLPQAIWLFIAIAAFSLGAGLFEFYTMAKKLELKADAGIGYIGFAVLFMAFVVDAPATEPNLLLLVMALFVAALLITQTFRFQKDFTKMLTGTSVTLLGVIFVAFFGGYIVSMRVGFQGALSTHLLAYFFLVLMGLDTGSYAIGKALGRHKLMPAVSPGKTWEGLIGGLLVAVAFGALSTAWFFPELPLYYSIPLALVLAAAGVLGDLAESAMKRGSSVKDTATSLPGHGGLLDRLDSLLLPAPILYYFARFYFS